MKSNARMEYCALAVAGLSLLLGSVATAAPTGKIEICHKAGERNQRILSINEEKDGEKHFGHGDYIVSVEKCDDIADNNCDGFPDHPELDNSDCKILTDDGDAICVSGECVVPPPACPCEDLWASGPAQGEIAFPSDFGSLNFSINNTMNFVLEYFTSIGTSRNIAVNGFSDGVLCSNSNTTLGEGLFSPLIPLDDTAAAIQKCRDYVEDAIGPFGTTTGSPE